MFWRGCRFYSNYDNSNSQLRPSKSQLRPFNSQLRPSNSQLRYSDFFFQIKDAEDIVVFLSMKRYRCCGNGSGLLYYRTYKSLWLNKV